jgi:hypothetical protein
MMNDELKLVPAPVASDKIKSEIQALLDFVTKMNERGDLGGILIVVNATRGPYYKTLFFNGEASTDLVGKLEIAKQELIASVIASPQVDLSPPEGA